MRGLLALQDRNDAGPAVADLGREDLQRRRERRTRTAVEDGDGIGVGRSSLRRCGVRQGNRHDLELASLAKPAGERRKHLRIGDDEQARGHVS
ncbi:MAG: hypothetical protein E6J82_03950, partial [Deltaproteobacteria bacterium]